MGFNIVPTTDDSTDTTTTTTTTTEDGGAPTGSGCSADPDTGITLCTGISTCPGLTVDQDLFPGCGFRIHDAADVIDLECACYGQICPIGIATTCDQATALMQNQSQYTVCLQVNEGRCTNQ